MIAAVDRALAPDRPRVGETTRVLVIGHTYMNRFGQAKYEALVRNHADVTVLGLIPERWPYMLQDYIPEERDDPRLRFVALPVVQAGWGSRYMFRTPRLLSLLRSFRPHIVQVEHEPVALVLAQLNLAFAALRQHPKIILFSWEDIRPQRNIAMRALANLIESVNVPRLAHAIPGNDDAIGVLREKGYRGPMTQLPQLGVDEETYSPRPEPAVRERLGLGDSFVVGFAGRLVPEKGLATLARALVQVPGDWRLLLVGRGDTLPDVRAVLASAGLDQRLVHVDSVPNLDLPPYLGAMDAFVLPSETKQRWQEQFGHVLIEAMACGVPVAGSTCGFIPSVIGDAGLTFPERDPAQLAHAISQLMRDPLLRERLAAQGRARVLERYTHDAVARDLYRVYRQVLGERVPPSVEAAA